MGSSFFCSARPFLARCLALFAIFVCFFLAKRPVIIIVNGRAERRPRCASLSSCLQDMLADGGLSRVVYGSRFLLRFRTISCDPRVTLFPRIGWFCSLPLLREPLLLITSFYLDNAARYTFLKGPAVTSPHSIRTDFVQIFCVLVSVPYE